MTELLSTVHLGEVTLKSFVDGKPFDFFGDVYVGYASESYWMPSEFVGVITDDGLMYRGSWRQGPEFDRLQRAFKDDTRLVEVSTSVITKRLNLFKKGGDNGQ